VRENDELTRWLGGIALFGAALSAVAMLCQELAAVIS
jgi:hypothetical protein